MELNALAKSMKIAAITWPLLTAFRQLSIVFTRTCLVECPALNPNWYGVRMSWVDKIFHKSPKGMLL